MLQMFLSYIITKILKYLKNMTIYNFKKIKKLKKIKKIFLKVKLVISPLLR